jgi:hypothetical protein
MAHTPCAHKIKHDSLPEALGVLLQRFGQPHSTVRRAYKCPECLHWHLTSRRTRWQAPEPFPIRKGYYAVLVGDRKVWQSEDERLAQRKARRLGGTVGIGWYA